jgi:hypothetical protein
VFEKKKLEHKFILNFKSYYYLTFSRQRAVAALFAAVSGSVTPTTVSKQSAIL